jgi:N-acetylglucosamine kinase-like BadF-type ATPase
MIDLNLIGNRIRELRRQRGLTQIEFAKILSVSFQAVSSWERGITPPDIENLMNIASYFGVLADTLLFPINENLYLGIDGGGTKTEFAVVSASGSVLKRIIKPGCNPNDIGFEKAAEIITSGINEIIIEYPTVKSIFCGIAGSSTGNFREKLCAILNKMHPKVETKIQSDAVNLFAICDQADIALISGTGSVALVKSGTGYKRLGGWGYLFDRAGSGFDIGCDAIRVALAKVDGLTEENLVTKYVEEQLGTDAKQSINQLYADGRDRIASFSQCVFKAAQENDQTALAIIERNTERLAKLINFTAEKYNCRKGIILSGGITKEALFEQSLNKKLDSDLRTVRSEITQVIGAARICMQNFSKKEPDTVFTDTLLSGYEELIKEI